MALPTLVKDYEVNANNTIAADNTIDAGTNSHRDRRNLMLAIHDALIAAGTSDVGPTPGGPITAWTVTQSSDGTTADTNDNWNSAITDLIWNTSGNAHSWCVFQQTGLATNFQVCIDLLQTSNGNDGSEITVEISPGGFNTDGTTTTRPTPTTTNDSVQILDTDWWGSGSNGGAGRAFVWNMWRTEDGEVTYVVIYHADNALGLWVFAKPQNPSGSWDGTQFVCCVEGDNSNTVEAPTIVNFYDNARLYTYRADRLSVAADPAVTTVNTFNQTTLYMTAATFGGGPFGQELTTTNDITGEYAVGAIGLASIEPGFVGRMGSMFDIYWGQDVLGQPADNYPSGGSKIWVQFASIIFPWDGAAPVTT
jgi:hypothetical protein